MFTNIGNLLPLLSMLALSIPFARGQAGGAKGTFKPADVKAVGEFGAVELVANQWTSAWSLDKGKDQDWDLVGADEDGSMTVYTDFAFNGDTYVKEHFNFYTYKAGKGDTRTWQDWLKAELVNQADYANKADQKFDCLLEGMPGKLSDGLYYLTATAPYLNKGTMEGAPVNMKTAVCNKIT